MVRGSNPIGRKIFCNRPDRPWGPPNLLYNGYWVLFSGGKLAGASNSEVKERVELYLWAFVACSRVNFIFFNFMRNGNGRLVFKIFPLILGNVCKPNVVIIFTAGDNVSYVINIVNLLVIVLLITSLYQILFF
jgi:hypothetical protein